MLFVHDPKAEEQFVTDGWGLKRHPVMYNDFVLVGPRSDPAGARGRDIVQAMRQLAGAHAPFISRGDKSGTHSAELRFWAQAGLAEARGRGYRECGCGMGPALNMAAASGAYVLADRGTWLNFRNRADLAILVEGDPRLFNPYGVLVVNLWEGLSRYPVYLNRIREVFGQVYTLKSDDSANRIALASNHPLPNRRALLNRARELVQTQPLDFVTMAEQIQMRAD